jgi:hypothetical protein
MAQWREIENSNAPSFSSLSGGCQVFMFVSCSRVEMSFHPDCDFPTASHMQAQTHDDRSFYIQARLKLSSYRLYLEGT